MAKKIISKASGGNSASTTSSNSNGVNAHHTHGRPSQQGRGGKQLPLSASESNLTRIQQQQQRQGGVNFLPDGGSRQQQQFGDRGQHAYGDDRVTVMKSKVLYHSRADFRSSTESSSIEWSSDQEAAL